MPPHLVPGPCCMESSVVSAFLPTHHNGPRCPRDICVDVASLTDLRAAPLSWVALVMQEQTQLLQPGLKLLLSSSPLSLPFSLRSSSQSPKYPNYQVPKYLPAPGLSRAMSALAMPCWAHFRHSQHCSPRTEAAERLPIVCPGASLSSLSHLRPVYVSGRHPSLSLGSQMGTMSRAAELTSRPGVGVSPLS